MVKVGKPSRRIAAQGWEQFLASRRAMLDAFDNAKRKSKAHKVSTQHGRVAEAEFRSWLSNFLPKKYGVTSGYVISQGMPEEAKTPHFDVIIYNQLESPVLWLEDNADLSSGGVSRAIPAEYVQAVIEVKSTFDASSAAKAIGHLFELEPLLEDVDPIEERYRKYLPPEFFCAAVYFEDRGRRRFKEAAMAKAIPHRPLRGFFGGIILRADDLEADEALRMIFLVSKTKYDPRARPTALATLTEAPMANHHTPANGYHIGAMLHTGESAFAMFAFDLVALLNGTYENSRISSRHVISGRAAGEAKGRRGAKGRTRR
jgi:hypothetical protein